MNRQTARVRKPSGLCVRIVLLLTAFSMLSAVAAPSAGAADHDGQGPPETEVSAVATALGLTMIEAREALNLSPDVAELAEQAEREFPDTFAGAWREYSGTSRVRLAFTSEEASKASASGRNFPKPGIIQSVKARFALRDLKNLAAQVSADVEAWQAQGVSIVLVDVDVKANAVAVGLLEARRDWIQSIQKRYGSEMLIFEKQDAINTTACERFSCIFPEYFRAGLHWHTLYYRCSTAFPAWRGGQGGYPGILSAGHCAEIDETAIHDGLILGLVAYQKYSGNVDGLWIDTTALFDPPKNWVWEEPWSRQYTITSRVSSSGGTVGDPICHSGYRRGYRCGQITSTSTTVCVNNGGFFCDKFVDMKEDDLCSAPGDSGGPAYSNHVAHGIINFSNVHENKDGSYRCRDMQTDGVNPRTWYSGIRNVESALGVITQTWP